MEQESIGFSSEKKSKLHIGGGFTAPYFYKKGVYMEIPIWEKSNLTLEEAAAYSNIGMHKLRELTNDETCKIVLWVGNKRLIKRQKFDAYINSCYSI